MHHIIIVEDHELMMKGIAMLLNQLPDFTVTHMARNGQELIQLLKELKNIPDIILLDINMPVMNGFETMEWLSKNLPQIPVITLTINDDDESVIKMIKLGSKGYLLKDTDEDELAVALQEVLKKGFYHSDFVNNKLRESLMEKGHKNTIQLKDKEREFLKLACSEMTYQQIADVMCLSPKTVDHYRNVLFEKFDVKSRVGLVLFALKLKLVDLNDTPN